MSIENEIGWVMAVIAAVAFLCGMIWTMGWKLTLLMLSISGLFASFIIASIHLIKL